MNVTEKHVPNVFGGETDFVELLGHIREGRFGASVEEHEIIVSLEGRCRDDASPAELLCIENMDVHCLISNPSYFAKNERIEGPPTGKRTQTGL
jgi:hypothetical protein